MGSTGAGKNAGGAGGAVKGFSFEGLSAQDIDKKIKELQAEMGQNGYEAGDPNASPNNKLYVNTGKSMNINAYLLSDGDTIYSSDSNWNGLIDKSWVKNAIKQIDSGMKPLTQSVQTYRFLNGDALGKMLGLSALNSSTIKNMINTLEGGGHVKTTFTDLLKNVDYTHKAYTSTTYVPEHGSYGDKDVRLNIVAKKGTNAIVTNNIKEHEIVLGRNQKYQFTGGWKIETTKTGKKQLVLDVII